MKRKNNKIYVFLLVISMLVTTALSGVNPLSTTIFSKAEKEINIYVEKPDNWRNIWIWYDSDLSTYAWDTKDLAQSPGDLQEYRTGWYKKTLRSNEVQFLFNDGSWNNKLTNNGIDFKTTEDIWIQKNGKISYTDPCENQDTQNSITVYYYSTNGDCNMYYWNAKPNGLSNRWPGDRMTKVSDNWYKYELKNTDSTNLIFNNNGANKTSDLSITYGVWSYKDGSWTKGEPNIDPNPDPVDPIEDSVHVYYYSENGAPNMYYWNTKPGSLKNTWPGDKMTKYQGKENWYELELKSTKSTNLIFNMNGSNQSADLTQVAGNWCYKDGKWTEGKPEDFTTNSLKLHFKSTKGAKIHYKNAMPGNRSNSEDGQEMTADRNNWYSYEIKSCDKATFKFIVNGIDAIEEVTKECGEWWYKDGSWYPKCPESNNKITIHYYSKLGQTSLHYWDTKPEEKSNNTSGELMDFEKNVDGGALYKYVINNVDSAKFQILNGATPETTELDRGYGEWWYKDGTWYSYDPFRQPMERSDFRDESIYFVMTSRFYDGDSSNNVHCWDDAKAKNPDSDPAWRGDFKGLIEKLDYIKALGFSAIWINPVVKNASGYDYHGYHAINFSEVDPRYESEGASYQDLINAAHAKGIKIIQDVVLNHTGNFGEENLFPLFKKDNENLDSINCLKLNNPLKLLTANYDGLTPGQQYDARIRAMKEDSNDTDNIYHHEKSLQWEGYSVQTGQIAGDCVDLNTENKTVSDYLINAYNKYIDMGVDSFRLDTVKHISRLSLNKEYIPAFKQRGGDNFYIFGEVATRYRDVWNSGIPAISTPFYTWKESKNYAYDTLQERTKSVFQNWSDNQNVGSQPTSNNYKLNGNEYHTPDYSMKSGLDVIDFPMHWSFNNARDAFGIALGGDKWYNDPTWNVTYVDSHDYAPDGAPENQRFAGSQDTWAENLNLMFTFRGIPTIYYGSEIEFMKGAPIDVGPNAKLSETGRAYFGDYIEGSVNVTDYAKYDSATGKMAETLNHPLAKHIQRLNLIRRQVPALRKGQYSTDGISGSMAFKRRYTDAKTGVDSFALVSITDGATFNNIPNGKYVDVITGDVKYVSGGSLSTGNVGKGNMRVYVLDLGGKNAAPGKIGESGAYLK
ncbi:MAG: starch-binding protein [Clostridium sp.]|nr:starch-binding protein [Clostridium sp.]